jgi:hypothetical protein
MNNQLGRGTREQQQQIGAFPLHVTILLIALKRAYSLTRYT